MKLLAADVGGTNTRLSYVESVGDEKNVLSEKSFLSAEYSDFNRLLNAFLDEFNIKDSVDAACFAVAGPVKSAEVSVTNLPWVINEAQLQAAFKIPRVRLINDFIAVAYGVSTLSNSDICVLQPGNSHASSHNASPGVSQHNAVVVGAGTGLGAAHLVWQTDHYQAYSSEAGHVGFSPQNPLQHELLLWLQKQRNYVCLEMLLSGSGLERIYQFLSETGAFSASAAVEKAMQTMPGAQVITEYALAEGDKLCQKTLDCFIDIYGAAAGDIVLHHYPLDELYIAGGIAAKIHSKMTDKRFINAFVNKGVMQENMKGIRVKLVCNEKVGLYGALLCAQSLVLSH